MFTPRAANAPGRLSITSSERSVPIARSTTSRNQSKSTSASSAVNRSRPRSATTTSSAPVDVAHQQALQVVEMLGPARPRRPLPQAAVELGDEPREPAGVLGTLARPSRAASSSSASALHRAEPALPLLGALDDPRVARERVPSRRRDPAVLLVQRLRELRVGQEVHHRLARQLPVEQRQQPERLAPDRPLRERRALVQVHRDPGLDEHRLGQRQIRLAVPVGDRHLPERHPLARPLKTCARRRTHLARRVRRRHQPERAVRRDRRLGRRREHRPPHPLRAPYPPRATRRPGAPRLRRRAAVPAARPTARPRPRADRRGTRRPASARRSCAAGARAPAEGRASPRRAARARRGEPARRPAAHRPGRRSRSGAARTRPGSPASDPAFSGASVAPSSSGPRSERS